MGEAGQEISDSVALTPGQLGLLVESQLSGHPALNVLQVIVHFEGKSPDDAALALAWQDLAARHDVLRLSLHPLAATGPMQTLHRRIDPLIDRRDWSALAAPAQEQAIASWLEQDRRRGLAPESAPMWRVMLINLGPSRSVMVWTFHHALLDGNGYRLLLKDLFACYEARRIGHPPPRLDSARPGFIDHCRAVAALDHQTGLDFFRQHLNGFDEPNQIDPVFAPPESALPTDPERRHHREHRLTPALSDALRARAAQAGARMGDLIAVAWALVLGRCSGRDEAVFGLTRAGRHVLPGGDGIAGCQINTLPLRLPLQGQSLHSLLQQVRAFARDTRRFQQTPVSAIAQACGLAGDLQLFQSILLFDRGSLTEQMRAEGPLWAHRRIEEQSQMASPLMLAAYDDPALLLRLDFDPALLSESGATRIFSYLLRLLDSIAVAGDLPVSRLEMLDVAERARLLARGTPEPQAETATLAVIDRFEAMVRQQPAAIAVEQVGHHTSLSYRALDARANHLARCLRDLGIGPGQIVGLALPRGPGFVAAMLAVLKVQAAFLPLDPVYPTAALADMIRRSGTAALFTTTEEAERLGAGDLPLLLLDDPALGGESASPPRRGAHDPGARAYVIYTSGSSGLPKGVEVPQSALSAHASAIETRFGLTPADRVLQFTSLNFDVSIEEILPTLLAGARLVLRDDAVAQSVSHLLAALARHRITLCNLPTAFWHVLVADLADEGVTTHIPDSLRLMIVGGERASGTMLALWRDLVPGVRWLNGYGPTEATITSTLYDAEAPPFTGGEVPIGAPLPHARAFVMAADGSLAPEGMAGELWIGGPAVATGYLGEPDKTAPVFLSDPFGAGRVYRTGDRVRWLPEAGTAGRRVPVLAYHGRIDRQVKLRGYRIEPSAVEAALESDPAVAMAVVSLRQPLSEQARLLAWVRLQDGFEADEEFCARLCERLPVQMVPQVIPVRDFPRKPGGKIDVAQLPVPHLAESAQIAGGSGEDGDPDVALVQEIFGKVLGLPAVGADESFFDLGGHSLLSVRLMSLLERRSGQRVSLATLLQTPTPRGIAQALRSGTGKGVPNALVPIQPGGLKPPLYAVHILGERGAFYAPLAAQLGPDQPLFGLTLDLLEANAPRTLPDLATIYRVNIERQTPRGPVQLIAVSQGGYIAFELARQLTAAGREVSMIYMLDAEGPGGRPWRLPAKGLRHYLRKIGRELPQILHRRYRRFHDEASFHVQRLRLNLARRGFGLSLAHPAGSVAAHQAAIDLAIAAYRPEPYYHPVTVFRATDEEGDTPEGIASGLGWRVVVPETLAVIETGGTHLTMLQEPHVRELAAHMARIEDRIAQRRLLLKDWVQDD